MWPVGELLKKGEHGLQIYLHFLLTFLIVTEKPLPHAMQFCTSWSSAHFLVRLWDCLILKRKHNRCEEGYSYLDFVFYFLKCHSLTCSDWFSRPSSCMAAVVSSTLRLSSTTLVWSFSISPSPLTHLCCKGQPHTQTRQVEMHNVSRLRTCAMK